MDNEGGKVFSRNRKTEGITGGSRLMRGGKLQSLGGTGGPAPLPFTNERAPFVHEGRASSVPSGQSR